MLIDIESAEQSQSLANVSSDKLMHILKHQCDQRQRRISTLPHQQALELLFAQFLFQYYGQQSFIQSPAIDKIMQHFIKPSARQQYTDRFSAELQQCLHHCVQAKNSEDLLKRLSLDQAAMQQLGELSKLLLTHQLLKPQQQRFQSTRAQLAGLDITALQILCCANVIYSALLVEPEAEQNLLQQAIFQEGLESAFIAEHVAKQFSLAPLQLALCTFVRSINLLLMHEFCQQHALIQQPSDKPKPNTAQRAGITSEKSIPSADAFKTVYSFLTKLDYWLAKDLGLDDNILYILKYAFVEKSELPMSTRALFITERCHLLFNLFKHGHIDADNLRSNMHQLGLRAEHFPQIYQTATQH